jgi:hypothetical protein
MTENIKHTQVLDILHRMTKNDQPGSLEPDHKQLTDVIDNGIMPCEQMSGPLAADGPNVGNPRLPNPVLSTPPPASIKR